MRLSLGVSRPGSNSYQKGAVPKLPANRFSRQSVFQIIDQLHSLIQALSHSEMIILGKRYDHEFEIEQLTIRAVENRTVENPSS